MLRHPLLLALLVAAIAAVSVFSGNAELKAARGGEAILQPAGAACGGADGHCQRGLVCEHHGAAVTPGLCTKVTCFGDRDCPHAMVCVFDPSSHCGAQVDCGGMCVAAD